MKETILIVDDNPTNLQVMLRLLSDSGRRVLIAEDGPSAIEQIAHVPPDLILLDVMMPVLDGFETCRRIKACPGMKDIPILFLTARSEISDKLKGFAAGGVDYITKPIQKEEVIARVETHLTILRQQRQLQSMLEQRQRFMRIAAHDLRNLLTVISGFAQLGCLTKDAEKMSKSFGRIENASQNMKAIIEDFLSLNILEQGKAGSSDVFDLREVIGQVVDQLGFAAQTKGMVLSQELPPGPLRTAGNVAHTHQILTNYVSNALKYSPHHSQTRISVRREERFWRVEIQDQGPGIPPVEREHLFVEFAKISNRPTGGETSTRLGLAIVKTLAEAQDGRVGADFPETGGSIFWLEIPAAQPEAAGSR